MTERDAEWYVAESIMRDAIIGFMPDERNGGQGDCAFRVDVLRKGIMDALVAAARPTAAATVSLEKILAESRERDYDPIHAEGVVIWHDTGGLMPTGAGKIIDASVAFFSRAKLGDRLYDTSQVERILRCQAGGLVALQREISDLRDVLEMVRPTIMEVCIEQGDTVELRHEYLDPIDGVLGISVTARRREAEMLLSDLQKLFTALMRVADGDRDRVECQRIARNALADMECPIPLGL